MTSTRPTLADNTGVLGASCLLLSGFPPPLACTYLALRTLLPLLLIMCYTRDARPVHRVALAGDYLLGRRFISPTQEDLIVNRRWPHGQDAFESDARAAAAARGVGDR